MTEIPEHLLKRAQAIRDQHEREAQLDPETNPLVIPEHLLKRAQAARDERAEGERAARLNQETKLSEGFDSTTESALSNLI